MGGVAVLGEGGGQEGPFNGLALKGWADKGESMPADGGDELVEVVAAPSSLRTPFMANDYWK